MDNLSHVIILKSVVILLNYIVVQHSAAPMYVCSNYTVYCLPYMYVHVCICRLHVL